MLYFLQVETASIYGSFREKPPDILAISTVPFVPDKLWLAWIVGKYFPTFQTCPDQIFGHSCLYPDLNIRSKPA
jgi:hypothetical protein